MSEQGGSGVEWDPLAAHPDVFAEYEDLRGRCPVAHSSAFGGYWMLSRYEDVFEAALDPATFASGPTLFVENEITNALRAIPVSLNRPEHTKYRRLLDRYFLARRVATFEATIRGLAKDQLGSFLEAGGGDFVRRVAYPFPARVLCMILGLDDNMWVTVKELSDASDSSRENKALKKEENERFLSFTANIIAQRRIAPRDPHEDLLSGVIAARIDGAPLKPETVERIVHQLFTAGHTTTSRALANAVAFLAVDSELQERLRGDPSLIPNAVEEFLRLRPPLHQIARTVTEEITVGGVAIHSGDRVVLNFASANRDDHEFDSPGEPDISRSPNHHLTFGTGIHKCLGAPVARMELRVVLEELLSGTSSIEIAEEGVIEERVLGGHFTSGYEVLPIRVTMKN